MSVCTRSRVEKSETNATWKRSVWRTARSSSSPSSKSSSGSRRHGRTRTQTAGTTPITIQVGPSLTWVMERAKASCQVPWCTSSRDAGVSKSWSTSLLSLSSWRKSMRGTLARWTLRSINRPLDGRRVRHHDSMLCRVTSLSMCGMMQTWSLLTRRALRWASWSRSIKSLLSARREPGLSLCRSDCQTVKKSKRACLLTQIYTGSSSLLSDCRCLGAKQQSICKGKSLTQWSDCTQW